MPIMGTAERKAKPSKTILPKEDLQNNNFIEDQRELSRVNQVDGWRQSG